MLFKMLGIERAHALDPEDVAKPRQLFVTQSQKLATKVQEYFQTLMESLAAASQSQEELNEAVRKKQSQDDKLSLVDDDEEYELSNELPNKFSLLQDEHFPLFCTFDHVSYQH
jgi:hypothetical protein